MILPEFPRLFAAIKSEIWVLTEEDPPGGVDSLILS